MSIEAQVLALFEEGNPVPDIDALEPVALDAAAYLATLSRRSSEVNQLDTHTTKKDDGKRLLVPWLVAAATVVVVGVALILLNQSSEDTPPVTEPTPTTEAEPSPTTTVPQTTVPTVDAAEEAAALALVQTAFDAYNSGDGRTWTETRDKGSFYQEEQFRLSAITRGEQVSLATHAAGGHVDVLGCESMGYDRWVGIADTGPVEAFRIVCDVVWREGLRGAAGLERQEAINWLVTDGEIVASASFEDSDPSQEYEDFIPGFYFWLQANQPEVFAQIEWIPIPFEEPDRPNYVAVDSVPLALDWVDAYVASLDP